MIDTDRLYAAIVEAFNAVIPAYFDEAEKPSDALYCVINSPIHSDIADRNGDLVFFYVDLYGDDRTVNNNVTLQQSCDSLRNTLDASVIYDPGHFGGHLNFEKDITAQLTDIDINRRRQEWTARVFYE